jgi:hypothetical protein
MPSLRVPSGIEITLTGLFRQIAYLTAKDVNFVFSAAHAKPFRKPVGELLGKAFAGMYNRRREDVTKSRSDFWKLQRGAYRKKFIDAAVNAKTHDIDPEILILRAEDLARSKQMGCYPTPHLVCGPYIFGEVLNGWTPGGDEPPPPDAPEDLGSSDHGEESWLFQPGYSWNEDAKCFVKDDDDGRD